MHHSNQNLQFTEATGTAGTCKIITKEWNSGLYFSKNLKHATYCIPPTVFLSSHPVTRTTKFSPDVIPKWIQQPPASFFFFIQ